MMDSLHLHLIMHLLIGGLFSIYWLWGRKKLTLKLLIAHMARNNVPIRGWSLALTQALCFLLVALGYPFFVLVELVDRSAP